MLAEGYGKISLLMARCAKTNEMLEARPVKQLGLRLLGRAKSAGTEASLGLEVDSIQRSQNRFREQPAFP